MAFKTDVSQLKLAEKLVILNDRSLGILTRIYNMKKACDDPKLRPAFLSDKSLDSAISHISKKFPVIDLKRNSSAFASVNEIRGEIIKNLSLYYYTFADLLELKDHILRMLTTMDANQCQLDITLNYDLTAGYLNLVVNYMSMMIMLSRVEDRKVVLGLFNAAYSFVNEGSEMAFPRLGQMIVDYEQPLRKLCEDLGPLNRLIHAALTSLHGIYTHRNITAEELRAAATISLISNPTQIMFVAQNDQMACEYLSLDIMDRWIVLGVTVCHGQLLADSQIAAMYNRALLHGMALRVFRDESILVFPTLIGLFDGFKGHHKRVQELKDLSMVALQTCGSLHAHRRQFLRSALRELCFLIRDQPGLLGPKILFVWMGLSFARDEVVWLLRHVDIWPQVNIHKKTKTQLSNVLNDKYLPELLYYITELRLLVAKHARVISKYYTSYVNGYDAVKLHEMVAGLTNLASHDELLVQSFVESITKIKDGVANGTAVDLRGVRLDWFRFQASTSVGRSTFRLADHKEFAAQMSTTVFHLKMIDIVEEMLRETSDLSIYCFYPAQFDAQLAQCLNFPAQSRYASAFALIATTFSSSLHEMCPEEGQHIIKRGLNTCNDVLEDLTRRATDVLFQMTEDEMRLEYGTSPQNCAKILADVHRPISTGKSGAPPPPEIKMPGYESQRPCGTSNVTNADKNYLYLVELCQALAAYPEIRVNDYTFVPREFLAASLERNLHATLMLYIRAPGGGGDLSPSIDNGHPRIPSEMLAFLQAQLSVLQSVDSCLSFNVARLFNDALLQQSHPLDGQGAETMAAVYTRWYLEVLLRRASVGELIYSEHFQAFLNNSEAPNGGIGLVAERYTDTKELRALCQLIGPYGVKQMVERLTWHVACQITELYRIVREYRETLHTARVNFDKPEKLREVVALLNLPAAELSGTVNKERRLTVATVAAAASSAAAAASPTTPAASSASAAVAAASASAPTGATGAAVGSPLESMLQRVTIIGEIIAFRNLLSRSLHDVLEERMPFLLTSVYDLVDAADELLKIDVGDMCALVGMRTDVDLALVNAIQAQAQNHKLLDAEEHYNLSCLLFVFIAIALPKLAVSKQSAFKSTFIASQNNCHTIPLAVSTMAGALFFYHRHNDVYDRMREFLALASSGLLQIVGTVDAEQMQQHRSVYILLERFVRECPGLNFGLLESCFPYTLLRCANVGCYRQESEAPQPQTLAAIGGGAAAFVGTALFAASTATTPAADSASN